jgi:aspartyl-tRNA(Asn)/glutamyl-tRNA(Gln) amidotransferase subunit A
MADVDFRRTPLADLVGAVRSKEIGARELTETALRRVEQLNPVYNAFVAVDGDRALRDAAAIDATIVGGGDAGRLAGLPLGVKDLQNAAGFVTTYGSALHADDPPATADDPFIARMRAAGCVVVGKTNTPEFGWMGNTTNAVFGASLNPFDTSRGPGGSSGGSAAALAAGMIPLATGSDGGGSIRIPSACCALSGMKPSLGRIPAGGPNPPGWVDLSTNGPMAHRMADVAFALDVAVGPDPTDLRSLPRPEANWLDALDDPHVPVKVAYSPTLGYATVDAEVAAACEHAVGVLASLGAEVVVVDALFDADPVGDFLALTAAATLRTLRPFMDHARWDEVDPVLRHFVGVAESTTAEQLLRVFDNFHRMNLRLVELFRTCRILVTPTTAGLSPFAGEITSTVNGETTANWVHFTYPFNMTRSPAASVCIGFSEGGLPIGLQLVGPQHGDLVVLRTAAALEGALALDTLALLPD